MTSNFGDFEKERDNKSGGGNNSDDFNLDDFELISAYLDGELTPKERNRVQFLLDNDSRTKEIYTQLSRMQSQMKNLVIPPINVSNEKLSENVFQKIDRDRDRKKALILGGAMATACLTALSSIIPGFNNFGLKIAQSPTTFSQPVMVAIALDKPTVKIPKAAGVAVGSDNTLNK